MGLVQSVEDLKSLRSFARILPQLQHRNFTWFSCLCTWEHNFNSCWTYRLPCRFWTWKPPTPSHLSQFLKTNLCLYICICATGSVSLPHLPLIFFLNFPLRSYLSRNFLLKYFMNPKPIYFSFYSDPRGIANFIFCPLKVLGSFQDSRHHRK